MSHAEGVNIKRRRVLIATTAAIGAVGVGAIATPFVRSWYPSAKAEAAGAAVITDISGIENGQMITVKYRGKPIFVVKRTEEMVANLSKVTPKLSDPDSEASIQPEYCKTKLAQSNLRYWWLRVFVRILAVHQPSVLKWVRLT